MEVKDEAEQFERSVARGRREGTPFYLLGQVHLVVAAVAAIVIAIALVTWLATK